MRKIIKLCLCGLAAATVVAGCSKKDTAEGTATASTATQETEALETVDLSKLNNGTITLGNYKGVEITAEIVEVTDEEVDAQVQSALDANPDYDEITDRGVQDGDTVNIDYTGMKDGEAFEGGTAKGFDFVVGETSFIDGFKEGLMGAKTGDELSLNLTFPEEYPMNQELAGQPVVFNVTVNNIKVEKPAEFNDEFVQRISEFNNVDEFKEDIKQQLLEEKQSQAEQKKQSDVLTAVINDSKIEANQEAIDANYNNMLINYTNQAAAYGMDIATFASIYGMDEATFKDQVKLMAESSVQQRLVFNAIAEKEGIAISDQDREDLAAEMGYEDAKSMVEEVGQYTVDDYLISTKTISFLVENAVIK